MSVAHWLNNHWIGTYSGSGEAPTIAVPTLAVADNGDGTGAVATIAGSTAGSTNTIYAAAWPGTTFVSAGSRSGNGTVALTLDPGPYWAYVLSAVEGYTKAGGLVAFNVTDGGEAVLTRCMDAVVARIQGLGLSGLTAAKIVKRKLPWRQNAGVTPPAVIVWKIAEQVVPATNTRETIVYNIPVTMIRAGNHDIAEDGVMNLWREEIRHTLRPASDNSPIMDTVPEVFDVRVSPRVAVDLPSFAQQWEISELLVQCYAREP